MTAAVILPDALLARFRAVAFERLERVDATWVALTHGSAAPNAEEQLFRELHTLKGDARVVGFADVAVLCQRLEDLLSAARQRRYRVHEDVDIVVTMAIQFVGMLLRKRSGVARSGIDLDGFIAQIEQVLSEWLRRSSEAPDGAVQMRPQLSFDEPEGSPAAARARLSVVATTVYLEHLRASGRSRARLREVWDVLSREIVDFEALPVAPLIARHTAASAELARELGKSVAIVADAGDIRVTKEVFNVLSTAILHGIRNAIDHGLELSAARERAGKPRLPTLRVSLHPRDDLLELEVADDGAGIDFEAVREVAARRGLAPAQWLGVAGPSELAEMLFLPGFSTRGAVTEVSGRGVGLDAVRSAAKRLGGTAIIESTPGVGTRLKVAVPHRSASIDVVLFQAPGSAVTFAVDSQWCVEDERSADLPLVDLLDLLDIPRGDAGDGGQTLCLRHGNMRCAVATTGSHHRASALRLCPTPTDAGVEVVKLPGTEAVLLRLECIQGAARKVPA